MSIEKMIRTNEHEPQVPIPTLERLAIYLRVLIEAQEAGILTLSSSDIEHHSGISAAQFRKDLTYFGTKKFKKGKPGVGYPVKALLERIESILKMDREQLILLVGAGNLGAALVGYPNFSTHGFRIAAVFDNNYMKIGRLFGEHKILDITTIQEVNRAIGAKIAIIAVPVSNCQEVADHLVSAGITGIMNFAPAVIRVPSHVFVRNVSVLQELAVLSYHLSEEIEPEPVNALSSGNGQKKASSRKTKNRKKADIPHEQVAQAPPPLPVDSSLSSPSRQPRVPAVIT